MSDRESRSSLRRAALAGIAWALLTAGCDKVVRIGTRVSDRSSNGGANSTTGVDSGGARSSSSAGGAGIAGTPSNEDETPEPVESSDSGSATSVGVEEPDEAQTDSAANTTCSDAIDAVPRWSFDADVEGWQVSDTDVATLEWSDAQGLPAPGTLLIDGGKPADDNLFVFRSTEFRDLSDTIVTLNLLLDSGDDIYVKLFAQSGESYVWVDGGTVRIAAGEWTCLALDIQAPVFRGNGFDPTRVRRVGVSINGNAFRVHLDELSY